MPMLRWYSRKNNTDSERLTYRIINWVVLGLMLYLVALPFLSPLLEKCFPSVWGVCPYLKLSGKPCPLCGGTRAVGALLCGNFHRAVSLNPLSILAVPLILSEAIFRALLLCSHISPRSCPLLVRTDILTHVLLTGIFICYICRGLCESFFT
ncbi:MAG: DUF2752 domain-containing protein [Planctomycetota bacterium]|jgi:hypothetical protein